MRPTPLLYVMLATLGLSLNACTSLSESEQALHDKVKGAKTRAALEGALGSDFKNVLVPPPFYRQWPQGVPENERRPKGPQPMELYETPLGGVAVEYAGNFRVVYIKSDRSVDFIHDPHPTDPVVKFEVMPDYDPVDAATLFELGKQAPKLP